MQRKGADDLCLGHAGRKMRKGLGALDGRHRRAVE
jgi:hypothetical protein